MSSAPSDADGKPAGRGDGDGTADAFGEMMAAWTEAQQRAWRGWADLAAGTAAANSAAGRDGESVDGASGMAGMFNAWQRMAEQSTLAFTAGANPVSRDVADRVVEAQRQAMRFGSLMVDAWRQMAALGSDEDAWATAMARLGQQLRDAATDDLGSIGGQAADMAELWRLYVEALQRMSGPWAEILSRSPGHFGEAMAGDKSGLRELSRMYWDAWERTGGRLIESPSLGFGREFEEDLLRGFDAWLDYRRAVLEYQVVYQAAWAEAVEAFLVALREQTARGEPVESLAELFELWTTATDGAMEAAFRTEEYAKTQGTMINAAMAYRKHERAIVETFLKMTDIPSRSELDEAFKAIYELSREVRELRRALEAATAEVRGLSS